MHTHYGGAVDKFQAHQYNNINEKPLPRRSYTTPDRSFLLPPPPFFYLRDAVPHQGVPAQAGDEEGRLQVDVVPRRGDELLVGLLDARLCGGVCGGGWGVFLCWWGGVGGGVGVCMCASTSITESPTQADLNKKQARSDAPTSACASPPLHLPRERTTRAWQRAAGPIEAAASSSSGCGGVLCSVSLVVYKL